MKLLLSGAWWKAAAWRAFRTVLVIATPYAATVLYVDGQWQIVLSAALLGAISSFLTSLFNIPETDDKSVSWYWALGERVIKTAAQALFTYIGTTVLFQDVAWADAWQFVGTAVLGSILLAYTKGVPEATPPTATPAISTVVVNEAGTPQVADIPVVANVAATAAPADANAIDPQGHVG